jgi:hypothetical protein
MSDADLEALARKRHIVPMSAHEDPEKNPAAEFFLDRPRIIASLEARDATVRSRWALVISILGLIIAAIKLFW